MGNPRRPTLMASEFETITEHWKLVRLVALPPEVTRHDPTRRIPPQALAMPQQAYGSTWTSLLERQRSNDPRFHANPHVLGRNSTCRCLRHFGRSFSHATQSS